jgi:hypothetical protein
MSAFMVSMAFGGFSDRPPESNVIPLPAKTTVLVAVLEPDQPRRVRRAHAHRQDAAVLLLGQLVLVQDQHTQAARASRLLGHRGQVRRHHVRGRGVDQVTDQGHRLGQDPGPARGGVLGGVHGDFGVTGHDAGRPVPAERVAAEQGAERDRLGLVRLAGRQGDGDPPGLARGELAGRGSGRAPQPFQVRQALRRVLGGTWLTTQAYGHDDRGRQAPAGGDLGELLRLAGRAERGQGGREVDVIDIRGRDRAVRALEHPDHEGVRIGGRRR